MDNETGFIVYVVPTCAGLLILIIIIIILFVLYRKKHNKDKKTQEIAQLRMDRMESQYARECREGEWLASSRVAYQQESGFLTNERALISVRVCKKFVAG